MTGTPVSIRLLWVEARLQRQGTVQAEVYANFPAGDFSMELGSMADSLP